MTWHINASKEMAAFLQALSDVKKAEIYGSVLAENAIDPYSDVDMKIFLHEQNTFNIESFIKLLNRHFPLLGYEIFALPDKQALLRLCFKIGWRFDLVIVNTELSTKDEISTAEKIDELVNKFWFIAVFALAKLGRRDYLIASHLSLELCQLCIVFQMLIRDDEKGTNVHKSGDREDVAVIKTLLHNCYPSENMHKQIVSIIRIAGEQMDKVAGAYNGIYAKRAENLINFAGYDKGASK